MKRFLVLITLLALTLGNFSCGGSGAGSADQPAGQNAGVVMSVELTAQSVAQTGTSVFMYAKLLDGNGTPVSNQAVIFRNLTGVGVLSAPSATTDASGVAKVNLSASAQGFVTVQAEFSTMAGQWWQRTSVFFTPLILPFPTLTLAADGDNDGVFNETGDLNLLEPGVAGDDQVSIRATVFDRFGLVVPPGSVVTFGSDFPSIVSFPNGDSPTTDANGQAFVLVQVDPQSLTSVETVLNITASADNGAFNLISLFLQPVTVGQINLSANPQTVESGGESTITAQVLTSAGNPVPDGTAVNFTIPAGTGGGIEPFADTTKGIATAKFTAPVVTAETPVTVTAKVGSVPPATVDVTVTPAPTTPGALTIVPKALSAIAGTGGTFTFTISGGTPPYTTTSSNPAKACNSTDNDCLDLTDTGTWTGTPITVTVPATATPGTVTLNVFDAVGGSTSATITIACAISPSISPISATICENAALCQPTIPDAAIFTISGGTAPYSTISSNTAVILNPGANPFTVNAINNSITTNTTVTLTVTDSVGCPATATVTVINEP